MRLTEDHRKGLIEAVEAAGFSKKSATRAVNRLDRMYRDINFLGANILDVGGGAGLLSYYAAARGANSVICLEPEGDGAQANLRSARQAYGGSVPNAPVKFLNQTFQDFDPDDTKFDIVTLHASVNHLDEEACIALPSSVSAVKSYLAIFRKLHLVSNDQVTVVVTDVSSRNFFSYIGIRNPWAPTIDWSKHQTPQVWGTLLKEAGFMHIDTEWITPERLGPFIARVLGNRLGTYFFSSFFRLEAHKSVPDKKMS